MNRDVQMINGQYHVDYNNYYHIMHTDNLAVIEPSEFCRYNKMKMKTEKVVRIVHSFLCK